MKFLYFHLIYLAIIAFLGYNYWSSVQAFKAFEHLDTQLKVDYEVMNNTASKIVKNIEKNAYAYRNPYNQNNLEQSEMAIQTALSLTNFIDTNKMELIKDNSFTDTKIKEIKEKLSQFSTHLIDSMSDKKDKADLLKYYFLPKLIADNAYWALIKTLPKNGAIAELSCIQNQIKTDEIVFPQLLL